MAARTRAGIATVTIATTLWLLAGCEKTKATGASGEATGSSGSAASAPDPCPPDVSTRVDSAMAATEAYFTVVAAQARTWTETTACEQIRVALDGFGPAADTFQQAVEAAKVWAKDLSEGCRDRLDELYAPKTKKLEASFRIVIDSGVANVKRCGDHPGIREAAARGLRLMRKTK